MAFRPTPVNTTGLKVAVVAGVGDFVRFESIPSGNVLTVVTNHGDTAELTQGRSWQVERPFTSISITGFNPGETLEVQLGQGWILDAPGRIQPFPPASPEPLEVDLPIGKAQFVDVDFDWKFLFLSVGNFNNGDEIQIVGFNSFGFQMQDDGRTGNQFNLSVYDMQGNILTAMQGTTGLICPNPATTDQFLILIPVMGCKQIQFNTNSLKSIGIKGQFTNHSPAFAGI